MVIGIASIRKIKKNKKKADEYIYNHLTAEEKEKFENKKIKDKEFADNSRYIIKILMFILMIVCPPLLVIFIIFMLVVKSSSKIKWSDECNVLYCTGYGRSDTNCSGILF